VYEGSLLLVSSPIFVVGGVFDASYLIGMRWNLSEVLICISFMAKDGEHLFMCFLATWTSSFEKVLSSSVAHFFIGSLIFREFSFFELPINSGYYYLV
jgi:hypothetical protein